jgi:YfiH family protein
MHFQSSGDIQYLELALLQHADVTHAVFARHGGVSKGHWASLNVSVSVGDSRENVRENRRRAFRALGRAPESIADLWQIHSADVVRVDAPMGEGHDSPKADALITNRPEVTLFLRFADCVPILLFDPKQRAVGLVHAGWRGTLQKAPAAAVQAMIAHYGSRPQDIVAGIGPSIGPCHYAVGDDVVAQTRAAFGPEADKLLIANHHVHLDLWQANALALRQAGVEQIEISSVCTACHPEHFFSHRGERGQTGRFGALIALR